MCDVTDWWRVERIKHKCRFKLFPEMTLPGQDWLEFKVQENSGRTIIYQIAIFDLVGLSGLLYWYGIWPLNHYIFREMLKRIANLAGLIESGRNTSDFWYDIPSKK